MKEKLLQLELDALTNEELVKCVQLTNEDCYWKEIEKRTQ